MSFEISSTQAAPQSSISPHQLPRLHAQHFRDPLQALQNQVPFSAFQSTHVGSVYAYDLGKVLLGQASLQPVGAQISAHYLLKISNCHVF